MFIYILYEFIFHSPIISNNVNMQFLYIFSSYTYTVYIYIYIYVYNFIIVIIILIILNLFLNNEGFLLPYTQKRKILYRYYPNKYILNVKGFPTSGSQFLSPWSCFSTSVYFEYPLVGDHTLSYHPLYN